MTLKITLQGRCKWIYVITVCSLHDEHEMNAYREAMSVCPSVRKIKLENCWTDLDEI
jgi:hypothetical protein